MIRRSSNQFSTRRGGARGSWAIIAAASMAAWIGACLAPDAQQGTAAASASSSGGGTSGSTGTGGEGVGGVGGGVGGVGGIGGGGGGGGASPEVSAAWLLGYGNGSQQSARAMTTDAAGNALVAGVYLFEPMVMDSVTLPDPEQTDGFVAKLTPDGAILWSRNIGGTGDQTIHSIAIDPSDGKIVVVGGFTVGLDTNECAFLLSAGGSDAFVVKLDPNDGSCVFSRAFGDISEQSAYAVAVDAAQAILVTGTFTGTLDFGAPVTPLTAVDDPAVNGDTSEIFLARLDKDGNALAGRSLGDAPFVAFMPALGVAADASNNILITGAFEGALEMPGGPIYNEGPPDLFVAKLSSDTLEPVWWLTSGDATSSQSGRDIAADASGNIYFGGYFKGDLNLGGASIPAGQDIDAFVAAVDPSGKPVWIKRIGGIGAQYLLGFALDAATKTILLGGGFDGVLDFDDGGTLIGSEVMAGLTFDAFVAKLSLGGERIWSFQGSGPDHQLTRAVAPAPSGAYAAGFFNIAATFGDFSVQSAGSEDIFIVKLSD